MFFPVNAKETKIPNGIDKTIVNAKISNVVTTPENSEGNISKIYCINYSSFDKKKRPFSNMLKGR